MTTNARTFRVYDPNNKKYLEGDFILTQDGKLKRESVIRHKDYPNMPFTAVEDMEGHGLEIRWNSI